MRVQPVALGLRQRIQNEILLWARCPHQWALQASWCVCSRWPATIRVRRERAIPRKSQAWRRCRLGGIRIVPALIRAPCGLSRIAARALHYRRCHTRGRRHALLRPLTNLAVRRRGRPPFDVLAPGLAPLAPGYRQGPLGDDRDGHPLIQVGGGQAVQLTLPGAAVDSIKIRCGADR
jgi:hypothetical protein